MIVTFCGHSKIYQTCEISKWLDIILPSLIEGGAATFYLGGYGDFDSLAAAAVRRQKAAYPNIEAVLVLAYLNRDVDTSRYDSTTFDKQRAGRIRPTQRNPSKLKTGLEGLSRF